MNPFLKLISNNPSAKVVAVTSVDPHNLLDARLIRLDDNALTLVSYCQPNRHDHHKGKRRILQSILLPISLLVPILALLQIC